MGPTGFTPVEGLGWRTVCSQLPPGLRRSKGVDALEPLCELVGGGRQTLLLSHFMKRLHIMAHDTILLQRILTFRLHFYGSYGGGKKNKNVVEC